VLIFECLGLIAVSIEGLTVVSVRPKLTDLYKVDGIRQLWTPSTSTFEKSFDRTTPEQPGVLIFECLGLIAVSIGGKHSTLNSKP